MIKVIIFLYILKNYRIVNNKHKKNDTLLFSCLIITTDLLPQLILYRAAGKTPCLLNRFGLSSLFYVFFFSFLFFEVFICSFIKLRNFSKISELKFWVLCPIFYTNFCHWFMWAKSYLHYFISANKITFQALTLVLQMQNKLSVLFPHAQLVLVRCHQVTEFLVPFMQLPHQQFHFSALLSHHRLLYIPATHL